MPEVFRFFGFSFFFYSKEHEPVHIHVEGNSGMAKFVWNGSEFTLLVKEKIKANDLKKITFLTHREINVAEFARSIGMNATLLRNYINGFKKPSAERESEILAHIHKLGKEMIAACF